MSAARWIFSVTVFPAVLGGALAWAAAAMARGVEPELAIAGPTVAPALLLVGLERLFPRHRSWLRSHGDVRVDLLHLVNVSLFAGATRVAVYAACAPAAPAPQPAASEPAAQATPPASLTLIRPDGSEGGEHALVMGENQLGRDFGARCHA